MNYSEMSYFDGFAFAHIAAFYDRKRMADLDRKTIWNRRSTR